MKSPTGPQAFPDANQAFMTSESRYRRLFETAQDGILLLNADTAQIEDVNPYLINLLGYSHAEFLGKKLWEVGSFADRGESKEMFTAASKYLVGTNDKAHVCKAYALDTCAGRQFC